jgi:hypothetical protein
MPVLVVFLTHPMNIQSAIRLTPVYTNEYSVSNLPDPWIPQQIFSWQSAWHLYSPMNIRSAIRLTCALHQWILGQKSTWHIHTRNEYWVGNPPDPCIRWMNIRLVCHLCTTIMKLFYRYPPDPYNAEWIFGQQSAYPLHTPNEYFVG